MKNHIYNLALTLQADYTKELQDFLKNQQDIRQCLIRAWVMTRLEQK